MWIFTTVGFFSVVQKPEDKVPGTVTIRSRVRTDLEELRDRYLPSLGAIEATPHADYQFRAKASREAFALALANAAAEVDYTNFKNAVSKSHGAKRAHVYGAVWSAVSQLASIPVKTKKPAASQLSFGGVLIDAQGKVLLRKPKDGFDGYAWTFAKMPVNGDEPEQTALAAVRQKTGYLAEIVARIPGEYAGGASESAYFLMRPVGKPAPFDPATTDGVVWATPAEAETLIAQTKNAKGRTRDLAVLRAALGCL